MWNLDLPSSNDYIEVIKELPKNSESKITILTYIQEVDEFVNSSDLSDNSKKVLNNLLKETNKSSEQIVDYKKWAINYILFAEKLLYPERDQWINAIIYKTWDSVHEAFISWKMDFWVPTKQDSLIFSDENWINYSRIEELEYSKENVERMRIKFLETKELLTAFIEDNYDDIESSNHITMEYYIKLTSLSFKYNEEDFKEFKDELIKFLKEVDTYINKCKKY